MSSVSENEITSGEPLLPLSAPELETVSGGDPLPIENETTVATGEMSDPISSVDTEALLAAINDGSLQIVRSQESAYTVAIILLALLVGIEWIKGFFQSRRT